MSLLIGLGYKARQGKNEAAQVMVKAGAEHGLLVKTYGFSDALKLEVTQEISRLGSAPVFFGEWDSVLPDWVVMESDPDMTDPLCTHGKYRTLLQWWGSEYRRAQDPDYWIKRVAERIAHDQPDVALLTDFRFINEGRYIKDSGGYCVKVSRTDYVSHVPQHHSETMLDTVPFGYWDFKLTASNIDDLRSQAATVFTNIVALRNLIHNNKHAQA
jgi:hypothetical protein